MSGILTMAGQVASGALKRRGLRPDVPRAVVFKVTKRCNLACEMCYTHEGDAVQEVTVQEAGRFFASGPFGGLHLLRFTGGEPFLRTDFTTLCQAVLAHARPQVLYLTTNGTFVDRLEDWLHNVAVPHRGRVNVQISLDAADERHDVIRKKKGALQTTLDAIAATAVFSRQHGHIELGVNQTLTTTNLDAVAGVAEVAKRHGAQHTVILAQEEHETRERHSDDGGGFRLKTPFTKEQLRALYADLEKHAPGNVGRGGLPGLSGRLRDATQSYVHHQQRRQLLNDAPPPPLTCMAAFTYLRIAPDGAVTPCTLKAHHVLGNIRTDDFPTVWHGEAAEAARRAVAACPGCFVECDVIPSFPYQPAFAGHVVRALL